MRRSRSRPTSSAAGCAAMPGEGFVGANVTVPHKRRALAVRAPHVRGGAGDRRREHAELRGRADPRRQHRRRRPDGGAAGSRPAAPRPGAGRRRRRPGRRLGAGCRRGAEVEVWNRTPERAGKLCAELGGREETDPATGALRADRQRDLGRPAGEDPFDELPLDPEMLGRRADRRRPGLRRSPESACCEPPPAAGADVIDGLEVLVRQGAGLVSDLDRGRAAARRRCARRRAAERPRQAKPPC